MVVDLVITWAILARECSTDVDPSGMAVECRPSDPCFEPDYATDVNACGDGDEADDAVKRWLIDPSSGYHGDDRFLY